MRDGQDYQTGDWVRFLAGVDGLVIAEVAYVRETQSPPWRTELVTNKGTVWVNDVLEVRPSAEAQ